ncbi:MAG: AMP-binding protein, partial [Sedimenticolaceae bacterium]
MRIDEFIDRSRELNGKVVKERSPWNTVATADAIRHIAQGISDDNPLWTDSSYAKRSRFGKLVAPPAFLTSVVYPMLHGAPMEVPLASLIGKLEYVWHRPVLVGDAISGSTRQLDVIDTEIEGRRGIYILSETSYWNGNGEVVGRANGTLIRLAVDESRPLTNRKIARYTDQQLEEIGAAQLAEKRTGENLIRPVAADVDTQVPALVRGPLTVGDMICWQAGSGPSYRPGSLGYRDALNAPHSSVFNPATGWPVKNSQQHEDFLLAAQRGMPAPFDNGVMRFAWITPLFTNWMGDNGELRKMSVQITAPNLYGDTTWYRGRIRKIVEEADGSLAMIQLTGTNQLGDVTTTGRAEVWLPREKREKIKHLLGTARDRDATLNPSWVQRFIEKVREQPDAIAVEDGLTTLSYAELDERATRWAHRLRARGAGVGRYVGLCLHRSADLVTAIVAVLKSGSAYIHLDPTYPGERILFMLEDARPVLL